MKKNCEDLNKEMKKFLIKNVIIVLGVFAVFYIIAFGITRCEEEPNIDKPTIGDIINSNDSIKEIVNNLDSAKQAQIHEAYNLSNDSALALFYELISK